MSAAVTGAVSLAADAGRRHTSGGAEKLNARVRKERHVMGLRGCSVVAAAAAVVALAGWAWGAAGDVPAAREGAARVARDVPFSFRYGGKDGRELLKGWRRTETDGGGKRVATYEDPATRLRVVCEVRTFADFPGVA